MGLNLHGLLRPHKNPLSVDMRLEIDAFLLDLPEFCQGKHLKSPGIGQYRTVPIEKFPYTAHSVNQVIAGTDMQMVGVGQLHLTANFLQIHGGHAPPDRRTGAHIHEHRRLYGTVYRLHHASAGMALFFQNLEHTTDFLSNFS